MSGNGRGWPYEPVDGRSQPPPDVPVIEELWEPSPATPSVSRRGVVLLSVAAAVAILVASLAVGDWWLRNREMQTLLGRVEQAERAQLPAIQGIGPLLFICQMEAGGEDQDLCDTVRIRQIAEAALPRLIQTGDEVADTRLTSTHRSIRTFRDRYVDHNLAWRSWLEALATDPTAGGFNGPDSIDTTFEEASRAADDALTVLPLHGNRDRVEAIFASLR